VICKRYDTVVVPFPFADIPILKRRPVVVLSGRSFNVANQATVVAMITTAKASS
jgi:mRNA interferase MazF